MATKPTLFIAEGPKSLCGYFDDERIMQHAVLYPPSRTLNDSPFKFKRMAEGFIGNTTAAVANTCPSCNECLPLRTNLHKFSMSKSQEHLAARSPFKFQLEKPKEYDLEALYQLYDKYIKGRHKGGQMDNWSVHAFSLWIEANPILLVAYEEDQMIGFSSIDGYDNDLALDYSAFDPDYSKHSIGKQMWLQTMLLGKRANGSCVC